MSNLLLLTGPSGAGKSTTASAFIEQAEGTWAYINQDELRQLVKAGYATADGYEQDWSEDTRVQWEVSIPICCDIAKRYLEYSINCLIDFNASPSDFKRWEKYLKGIDYTLIILLPSERTVISRNAMRDERSRLKENKIVQNFEKLFAWKDHDVILINNDLGLPKETVVKLNGLVK